MTYCRRCGVQLQENAEFCHKCGTPVVDFLPPPPPPETSLASTSQPATSRRKPTNSTPTIVLVAVLAAALIVVTGIVVILTLNPTNASQMNPTNQTNTTNFAYRIQDGRISADSSALGLSENGGFAPAILTQLGNLWLVN